MKLSSMVRIGLVAATSAMALLASPGGAQIDPDAKKAEVDARIAGIHRKWVFADLHSHPSHFHRDNVTRIDVEELNRYKRAKFDIITTAATADNFMSGNYTLRDGKYIEPGQYKPKPGDFTAFTLDRLERVAETVRSGDVVLASSPAAVEKARAEGKLSVLMAMEGTEGLEENIANVKMFYDKGVRMMQPVHIYANAMGSSQYYPYTPTGLTPFGVEFIKEANRLGIVIDLAHANARSRADALRISTKPMIFSHTASHHLWKGDRGLDDDEMKAIADKGGVIGVWVNVASYKSVKAMVDDIEYITKVVGIDHVGIGSDLRGLDSSGYTPGFGAEGNFVNLERELASRSFSDDDIGKILGGNFFRVWKDVVKK